MYSCSPAALKQFMQTKQEAPCTSANCKAERDHWNETFNKLARAFAQVYELAESADRTAAQAVASVQRVTQEFEMPLQLPVRNTNADQDRNKYLHALAEKIRKTYGLEPSLAGTLVACRKRTQAAAKDRPMQSSAAGPSHGSPDDDDIVVINDDNDEPTAPPAARPTAFVNAISLQRTSSPPSVTTSAKACKNEQRETSPMSHISGCSSPPSLGTEQDDMDVEVVVVPPPPAVQFTQVQAGVDGSMPLYALGPSARRIYATPNVLDALRRSAAHPLDFPPSEAHRSIPLSLHTIIAETTILGPEQYKVVLIFDGLNMSQKIALHYYMKTVADSSLEDAQWQLHEELGPRIDGKPRTRFELLFDHVETGEIVMFSCRVVLNGRMGPFSLPFAVSLSRPANGITSIVTVRAPQWTELPTPEVVELD